MKTFPLYLIFAGLAFGYPIELAKVPNKSHYTFGRQHDALEVLSGLARNHYASFVGKPDQTLTLEAVHLQNTHPVIHHDVADLTSPTKASIATQRSLGIQYPSMTVELPRQLRSKIANDDIFTPHTISFVATWFDSSFEESVEDGSPHYSASDYQSTPKDSPLEQSSATGQTVTTVATGKSSDSMAMQSPVSQGSMSTETVEKYQGTSPASSTIPPVSPSSITSTTTANSALETTSKGDYHDVVIDVGVTLTIVRVVTVTEDNTESAAMPTPIKSSTFKIDSLATNSIPLQAAQALPSHHHESISSTESLKGRDSHSVYVLPPDEVSAINSEKGLISRAAHLSASAD
ncbi:hypothetical protein LPJ81_004381 [Coemansia sp. IMI 209127]|nr:hypothetical protein LPJ81_004381 [Coemansia sp. IMI 209127]